MTPNTSSTSATNPSGASDPAQLGHRLELDVSALLELYERMLVVRRFEEACLSLHAEGLIAGSIHPCIGQEAVPVGALSALGNDDPVIATYRGHGWAIAAGLPLEALLGEILGREGGTNGGRGGSPYLSSPGTRFLGENSIVGAGLPIADGVALAARTLGIDELTIVSFGDGATNQGAAHEALVFAIAESLPVVFVCENNAWSEMTPIARMVPTSLAARAGAYGMPAETVDGTDPLAVRGAVRRAAERARAARGPTFLECVVPRILGHYQADIEHYRTEDEKHAAAAQDPIPRARRTLEASGIDSRALDDLDVKVSSRLQAAIATAKDMAPPNPATAALHVVTSVERRPPQLPELGRQMAFGMAINNALHREMQDRPDVVVFGEDVAVPGGVFGVTRNLQKAFGGLRVFDTPISESAILGAAVGASMRGLRPIVEIMWIDFLLVALDQMVNQAANVRYLSSGRLTAPLVVRTQQGVTPGSCAQHSQSLETILAHVPGLKVGLPSTPHDAYSMTRAAVADEDPVILIESRALYQATGIVDTDAPVESVGGARLRIAGADVLIVTWGAITTTCIEATEVLSASGISAGVIDLRWLSPLDFALVQEQLSPHSGKVLIVHEANRSAGFGAEIAARLAEECLYQLDGPVVRLAAPDVRMPAAPVLQRAVIPSLDDIVEAATRLAGA